MLEKIVDGFVSKYDLKEVETGEFSDFKVSVLNFKAKAYEGDFGHVSYLNAKGLFGLMNMETVVINPFNKDMPLYSIDYIKAFGNNKLFLEQYDTNINDSRKEEGFNRIIERYRQYLVPKKKAYWYDDIRYESSVTFNTKDNEKLMNILNEYTDEYLILLDKASECDRKLKKEKARKYSHGLIENGGPATDSFVSAFGKDKTKQFFDMIMFG